MNTIRKLPIGIQDFEYLRTDNCLYVDKTQYIYKLLQHGKPYFLGRPRRFGKSLFLSTLKAYFEGKKELFEGLKIAELEKEWKQYPVFYLDFNRESYIDLDSFNAVLDKNLRQLEKVWGKDEADTTPAIRFSGLIQRTYEKTGKQVVVLIDEYDKPLISTMDNPGLNKDIRTILKGFYGVLKAEDACLKFVFLTGVTKFSKVSVFSDLNHLTDISLDKKFAEVCGISETELLQNFQPEIQALADENNLTYEQAFAELKKRYDGYHFAKISADIYNPFSVLNTFRNLDFAYYWFATGTPTFLAKALRNQNYDIRKFEDDVLIDTTSIMDYQVENQDLIPLLYQSGYLTIKSYKEDEDAFVLGFPNEEVKYGFLKELLPAFVLTAITTRNFSIIEFLRQIKQGDIDSFMTSLKAFFAAIPYDAIKQEHRDEQYYQHVFYLLFTLMGQFTETEVKSNKGRADAVVKTADHIYIFEFKMDASLPFEEGRGGAATAEAALAQINSKDYAIPYTIDHRRLVKIGVEFSQTEKGVKRWVIE
ncbi:MAG: ATP-binding protein [Lentimicrobiaceae bacterium]|nr:ATP-binding protein [Lentimicrobiaceae bacterium]